MAINVRCPSCYTIIEFPDGSIEAKADCTCCGQRVHLKRKSSEPRGRTALVDPLPPTATGGLRLDVPSAPVPTPGISPAIIPPAIPQPLPPQVIVVQVPATVPPATPAATTHEVTLARYKQIKPGMAYEDVCVIFGGAADHVSTSKSWLGGETTTAIWKAGWLANATITFTNNAVSAMNQILLG
jgi:hypothetical protein